MDSNVFRVLSFPLPNLPFFEFEDPPPADFTTKYESHLNISDNAFVDNSLPVFNGPPYPTLPDSTADFHSLLNSLYGDDFVVDPLLPDSTAGCKRKNLDISDYGAFGYNSLQVSNAPPLPDSTADYESDLNLDYNAYMGNSLIGESLLAPLPSPVPFEMTSDNLEPLPDISDDRDLDLEILELPFRVEDINDEFINGIVDEVSFEELPDSTEFHEISEDNSTPSSNKEANTNLPIYNLRKYKRKGKSLPVSSEPSMNCASPFITPPESPEYHPYMDHCYCLPRKLWRRKWRRKKEEEEEKENKFNYWGCSWIIPPSFEVQSTSDSESSSEEEEIDVVTVSTTSIVPKFKPPPKSKGRRGRKCVKKAQVPLSAKSLKTAVQNSHITEVRRTYNRKKKVSNSVKKSPSNNLDASEASKRAHHNSSERQRREVQKDNLQQLRVWVPATEENPKASKVSILNSAVDYINYLKSAEKDLIQKKKKQANKMLRMLKQKKALLKAVMALKHS